MFKMSGPFLYIFLVKKGTHFTHKFERSRYNWVSISSPYELKNQGITPFFSLFRFSSFKLNNLGFCDWGLPETHESLDVQLDGSDRIKG